MQALCTAAGVDGWSTRAADLRKGQRQALLAALTACRVDVAGHEGYMKARADWQETAEVSRRTYSYLRVQ